MDINKLIAHYQNNYAHKIFLTRLADAMQHAYIMYVYDYNHELENFSDTFLKYLPFYVRNSDYFATFDESTDIDVQLVNRSKNMRRNSQVIAQRKAQVDGIYGELFLDFYLRIVSSRNAVLTYANKRSFASNYESTGPEHANNRIKTLQHDKPPYNTPPFIIGGFGSIVKVRKSRGTYGCPGLVCS